MAHKTAALRAAQNNLENNVKFLLTLAGITLLLSGLFFAGQGLGYIQWPASSFMVNDGSWAYYGAGIAAVGLILVFLSRR